MVDGSFISDSCGGNVFLGALDTIWVDTLGYGSGAQVDVALEASS